jgi:inositol phosphorylceramide synthase catalytic subunit
VHAATIAPPNPEPPVAHLVPLPELRPGILLSSSSSARFLLPAMQEFAAVLPQPKAKILPFAWPVTLNLEKLNPIPHKYRPSRKTRMRLLKIKSNPGPPVGDDITRLQTSFNVLESIQALRQHRWRIYDLQHLVVFGITMFSLFILPSAPLLKTGAMVVLSLLLLMPITSQFFLPSLPIWTYLLYFFSSR